MIKLTIKTVRYFFLSPGWAIEVVAGANVYEKGVTRSSSGWIRITQAQTTNLQGIIIANFSNDWKGNLKGTKKIGNCDYEGTTQLFTPNIAANNECEIKLICASNIEECARYCIQNNDTTPMLYFLSILKTTNPYFYMDKSFSKTTKISFMLASDKEKKIMISNIKQGLKTSILLNKPNTTREEFNNNKILLNKISKDYTIWVQLLENHNKVNKENNTNINIDLITKNAHLYR